MHVHVYQTCVGEVPNSGFETYSPQVYILVPRGLLHNQCVDLGEGVPASWKRKEQGREEAFRIQLAQELIGGYNICKRYSLPAAVHEVAVRRSTAPAKWGEQAIITGHFPLRGPKGRCCYCSTKQEARVLLSLQTVPAPLLHGQQGRRGSDLLRALAHRRPCYYLIICM